MNSVLVLILLFLMIIVGGKRGFKSFISLIINFSLLLITFYLISIGINSIIITILLSIATAYIILFFVNGKNIKTESSFKSIIIVYVFLLIMIIFITNITKIGGFGIEELEEISMFSYDINLNMNTIMTSLILIGLIGAITDTSIAISSALYEVYYNNKLLSRKSLFNSGLNIGKDILGTTVNTLLFAFLGEFLTLIIWFKSLSYSLDQTINSKVLTAEVIKILFSNIGCILIIPITAFITSYYLTKHK